MQTQPISLSCDDSYISLLLNPSTEQNHADHETLMSDDKYAEELQLQETIMASLITIQKTPNISANNSTETGESSSSSSNPRKLFENPGESSSSSSNPQKLFENAGESSSSSNPRKLFEKDGESSQTVCEICAERKDSDQMFPVQSCTHSFCTECITKHITIRIKKQTIVSNYENTPTITCPAGSECKGVLEVDTCREIVPKEVLTMWDQAITESMIPSSQRFYCPYKNCSALLVNDGDGTVVIREAECPSCRRLFCVHCNVPWHGGVTCDEFSKMTENEREREDLMVHELAKKNQWQRCPRCKYFVEKNEGCIHMTCRCGFQFCYKCGATWSSTHGGC